jgi:hypothetical protein
VNNKENLSPLKSNQVVELATKVRNKLSQLGIKFKSDTVLDGVPVDLADIYEISVAYQCLINELVELSPSQRKQARHLIERLHQHLYVHLPYHLKNLSKAMDDLTKGLNQTKRRQPKKRTDG